MEEFLLLYQAGWGVYSFTFGFCPWLHYNLFYIYYSHSKLNLITQPTTFNTKNNYNLNQLTKSEFENIVYGVDFFYQTNFSVDSIDQSDEGKNIVYGVLNFFWPTKL